MTVASNDRTLRYNVEVSIEQLKRNLEEGVSKIRQMDDAFASLNKTGNSVGGSLNFDKTIRDIDKVIDGLKMVENERQVAMAKKNHGINDDINQLIGGTATLSRILRELKTQKEVLMRGGIVKNEVDADSKTLQQVLAQIKVVEDKIKEIKNLDINKIIDAQAKAQFTEITNAIKEQQKAMDAYTNSIQRNKEMAESYWKANSARWNGASKTLEKYGIEPITKNPYEQGYSAYLSSNRDAFASAKLEHYQNALNGFFRMMERGTQLTDAELQKKTNELTKVINELKRYGFEDLKNPYLAFNKASEFNRLSLDSHTKSVAEAERVYKQLQHWADQWNIAFSRGKQITQEELEVQKRITAELEKQHSIELTGKQLPYNRLNDFSDAKEWNTASAMAKNNSAIANIETKNNNIRSYEQQISHLQATCESLYTTYRNNPTKENLTAFAQTRAALQKTKTEYDLYARSVEGASRTMAEFGRKAMSHFQWIVAGSAIQRITDMFTNLENALTSIDYKMAGIRQVIPSIEANPELLKNGEVDRYNEEVKKMNDAMTDFIQIGADYGIATDEVLESARSIGRMYGQGENGVINTQLFTRQAAKMAVADAFSMEEATKGLEAAMSQWNLQTEDTNELMTRSNEIIDIWTRTAHSGAASGQDIAQAIEVAGAAAAQAGVSFGFFNALVETGVRTTARSGNEIGQALKSLFVTMQAPKAVQALEAWGIQTKEIGEDGKEHMRSMEKQILDVSLAVSSTNTNTAEFLKTLSGGKYQYSKISAILKNYKEILRMQGVLNDGKTQGFADEQVQVQLDTIQRKCQQIKSEVTQIIADIGKDGGFAALKRLADIVKDVTTGIHAMNEASRNGNSNLLSMMTTVAKVVTLLGGLKAVSVGATNIFARGYGVYSAYQQIDKSGVPMGPTGAIRNIGSNWWENVKKQGNEKGVSRASEYLADKTNTGGLAENTVNTNANTSAKEANATAERVNTVAVNASTNALKVHTGALNLDTTAQQNNAKSKTGGSVVKATETASTEASAKAHRDNALAAEQDAVATNLAVVSANKDAAASTKEATAEALSSNAKKVNASNSKLLTLAQNQQNVSMVTGAANARKMSVAARALAASTNFLTGSVRAFNIALAALGGPVGIAVTALTVLGPMLLMDAYNMGEAANATDKLCDKFNELSDATAQNFDNIKMRGEAVESLIESYNNVADSLAQCTEGSDEYQKKQEQLKDLDNTIAQVMQENTDQFKENGRYKIETIKKFNDEQAQSTIQQQKNNAEQAQSAVETAKKGLEAIDERIEGLQNELNSIHSVGKAYNWLKSIISDTEYAEGKSAIEAADNMKATIERYYAGNNATTMVDDFNIFIKGGIEGFKEAEKTMRQRGEKFIEKARERAKDNGDDSIVKAEIERVNKERSSLEQSIAKLEENAAQQALKVVELQQRQEEAEKNQQEKDVDETDYDLKKGRTYNDRDSDRDKKIEIDYDADELSRAIHEAASSEIAKKYGITEPLLRAIAARESGGDTTIRQWNEDESLVQNGSHLGMFQVTQADADRFNTGDISVPFNNAMTAVTLLAEKLDATGNLHNAIKAYGENTDEYVKQVEANHRAQLDSFKFDKNDWGTPNSYNTDVLSAAKQELGLPYGGSSWRDEMEKVCTTFIQKALIDAGTNLETVENLSADANNWSTAAGYAFHPYSEIQSGEYKVRAGDIGLTNIDESGHAGHVILIGEDGQGYYASGGSKGVSAYYDTNWETAFRNEGGGIEGVISINELSGKPYTVDGGTGRKKPKSINDFRADPFAEVQYQRQMASENAELSQSMADSDAFFNGGVINKAMMMATVENMKLAAIEMEKEMLLTLADSVNANVDAYLQSHSNIGNMLKKRGLTWEQLVPAERQALASLADDESFVQLVKNQEEIRKKVQETTLEYEKQKQVSAQAEGYLNVEQRENYKMDRMDAEYEAQFGLTGDEAGTEAMIVAQKKNAILQERLERQKLELEKAKAEGDRTRAELLAQLTEDTAKLDELIAKRDAGDTSTDLADNINAKTAALKKLQADYISATEVGTKAEREAQLAIDQTTKKIIENQKTIKKVELELKSTITSGIQTMFSDILFEGKSFSESWQALWKSIGQFALRQLLMVQLQKVGLGLFSDGGAIPAKADGGLLKFADGGPIPGYADGGKTPAGLIRGAGTGRSDSILAYLANKDKFVFLSNGEYVMTEEATKRIGKDNLDAMNYSKFADGGSFSPTPYVPQLSASSTAKAKSINKANPNARMEELMQQQTDVIKNSKDGDENGKVVILNTQADSTSVMAAIAKNPRMLQRILGNGGGHGFRG
jgi:TP901 family phage tail tape measure protein